MRLLLFLFLADEVIEDGDTDRDDFDESVEAENGDVGEPEFCFHIVEIISSFFSLGLLFTVAEIFFKDSFAPFSFSLLLDTLSIKPV